MIYIQLTPEEKKARKAKQNREAVTRYYNKNKDKVADRAKRNRYAVARRVKAVQALGGECVECGITDIRCLQIDHIHGGGTQERRILSDSQRCKYITEHTEEAKLKYQVLCANHNWIKRYENEECKR